MGRLVGTGSSRGASLPGRAADVCRRPQAWAALAAGLSLTGARGRRAVLRGSVCAAAASLIHLPIKAAVGRSRPRGAAVLGTRRSTSSFPSGHTASDLSFVLGAAQEVPGLMVLSLATLGSHWSLIRSRIHYPSDVLGGGAIAVVVAAGAWKLQPPRSSRRGELPTAAHRRFRVNWAVRASAASPVSSPARSGPSDGE